MQHPVVCAPPLSGVALRMEDVNADWDRVVSGMKHCQTLSNKDVQGQGCPMNPSCWRAD